MKELCGACSTFLQACLVQASCRLSKRIAAGLNLKDQDRSSFRLGSHISAVRCVLHLGATIFESSRMPRPPPPNTPTVVPGWLRPRRWCGGCRPQGRNRLNILHKLHRCVCTVAKASAQLPRCFQGFFGFTTFSGFWILQT